MLHLLRTAAEHPEAELVAPGETVLVLDETPADDVLDAILRSDAVAVW